MSFVLTLARFNLPSQTNMLPTMTTENYFQACFIWTPTTILNQSGLFDSTGRLTTSYLVSAFTG